MPRRIAEHLRQLALKCSRLARDNRGQAIAGEFEGLAVELAQDAHKLDQLIKSAEKAGELDQLVRLLEEE